jgi:hypothetical protein
MYNTRRQRCFETLVKIMATGATGKKEQFDGLKGLHLSRRLPNELPDILLHRLTVPTTIIVSLGARLALVDEGGKTVPEHIGPASKVGVQLP